MTSLMALMLIIIACVFASYGALYLKKGTKNLHRNIFSQWRNVKLVSGIALYCISSVFFIISLKFGELSVLYPFSSLTYVGVCILSVYKLGEKMNHFKMLGIALIILGVSLVRL